MLLVDIAVQAAAAKMFFGELAGLSACRLREEHTRFTSSRLTSLPPELMSMVVSSLTNVADVMSVRIAFKIAADDVVLKKRLHHAQWKCLRSQLIPELHALPATLSHDGDATCLNLRVLCHNYDEAMAMNVPGLTERVSAGLASCGGYDIACQMHSDVIAEVRGHIRDIVTNDTLTLDSLTAKSVRLLIEKKMQVPNGVLKAGEKALQDMIDERLMVLWEGWLGRT